uniref:Uncharacterized protein n=1 Tax=Hanusia phi TaxID=3032 RepID=A0A7S0E993_9CRYP|mmetsp:Transcript_18132/g.41131  ORF Transcript_18132/g.41131 Transcript_18132/m.41131 type:complete len:464 (+) Transcript_18132:129-1520(+)
MKPRARELGRSGLGETETRRIRRSLFATSATTHAEALEETAKAFGKQCAVRSICTFTSSDRGGNQVAVIEDSLDAFEVKEMVRIAESCSEGFVVFVKPQRRRVQSSTRSFSICLFTPGGGCHRTLLESMAIASLFDLLDRRTPALPLLTEGSTVRIKAESFVEHVWQNEVNAEIDELGCFWVEVPCPRVIAQAPEMEVCEALNVNMLAIQTDLPIQVVECAARHLLVPVRSRRVIADLDPHWELVCEVCKQLQCDDVHVFSLDPASGGHVHTRNFNPIHRMEEEAASASSNAALVAYLHVNRVLPIESHDRVICEQGYSCGLRSKPSKVFVKLQLEPGKPSTLIGVEAPGVTGQNSMSGEATGEAVTKERNMIKASRYISNQVDETRFNLPDDYYREQAQRAIEIQIKMEAAKRAGKVYKEEENEPTSVAILPPPLALPAPISSCWVGGTCVKFQRQEYKVKY